MAKSSLSFTDRKRVKVLNTAGALQLERADCGTVFILNSVKGHTITLPTAHKAGPGWNARFIVGTVQNDLSDRTTSSVVAQGSETVTIVRATTTGAGSAAGSASARADALDTTGVTADGSNPGTAGFTITVPVAAGGSGTQFTVLVANDADEMPGTNAAATFVIGKHNAASDALLQAAITDAINGAANAAVERPSTGEGSQGTGLKGITAAEGTSDTEIDLTCDVLGAAATVGTSANFITVTGGVAGLVASRSLAAGANKTGVSASGQTVTVAPSGIVKGDQIEICEVNDKWQVRAIHSA